MNLKSKILDCEFDLFDVNGFKSERFSVPGASSWYYKFGVSLNKSDISKWTNGLRDTVFSNCDFGWVTDLIKHRHQNWLLYSKPKFYLSDSTDALLIVYEDEGAIFQEIINE